MKNHENESRAELQEAFGRWLEYLTLCMDFCPKEVDSSHLHIDWSAASHSEM